VSTAVDGQKRDGGEGANSLVPNVLAYLERHADDHLTQLESFLRIPSISADPARIDDVRMAAHWLVQELSRIGFDRATLHETCSHPVVTAESAKAGPAAPTILVYCHYDVQPVDPLDEWGQPPFAPLQRDGRLYARGAGDDKGQLFMHLKVAEAWLATAGKLPVNLRFVFEGDEEHDSGPIRQFISDHPDLLAADICIVSDTAMHDEDGTPAIVYGLRGIAHFDVHISGPQQDLHSGQFGGGVDNPANVLIRMLAGLTDGNGRVSVAGFYDRVVEPSAEDRDAAAALELNESEWAAVAGVPAVGAGEPGYSLVERLSARPTLDVHGIRAGSAGGGVKTIIPASASAKFSCRLVPDQDPVEITSLVTSHLAAMAPPSVRLEVTSSLGARPTLTRIDHPAVPIVAAALELAFGKAPVFERAGGSVPFVEALEAKLGLSTVLVGFASPAGNFHAPNEWMAVGNIRQGMMTIAHLWALMASLPDSESGGMTHAGSQ